MSHPELDAAVMDAAWRTVGDRRLYARKKVRGSDADHDPEISMLEGVTVAKWAADQYAGEPFNVW